MYTPRSSTLRNRDQKIVVFYFKPNVLPHSSTVTLPPQCSSIHTCPLRPLLNQDTAHTRTHTHPQPIAARLIHRDRREKTNHPKEVHPFPRWIDTLKLPQLSYVQQQYRRATIKLTDGTSSPGAGLARNRVRKVQRGGPRVQDGAAARQRLLARRRQVLVGVRREGSDSRKGDREAAASGTVRLQKQGEGTPFGGGG